jgi:hypothetical protein
MTTTGLEKETHNSQESKNLEHSSAFKEGALAIDPSTLALAMKKFSEYAKGPLRPSKSAEALLDVIDGYTEEDMAIHDVVSDVGGEERREELNRLAETHGFEAPFKEKFDELKVGLLSIVDKKMKWHQGDAEKSVVHIANQENMAVEGVEFKLKSENDEHFSIYDIKGFTKPVVRISANPEGNHGVQNYMWVTEIEDASEPELIDVFKATKNTINIINNTDVNVKRRSSEEVSSVTIPEIPEVKYEKDWEELENTTAGLMYVAAAKQAIRVKVDHVGAEASAATSLTPRWLGGEVDNREKIVIGDSGHMLIWFTEGDSRLPICATVTTSEAWNHL